MFTAEKIEDGNDSDQTWGVIDEGCAPTGFLVVSDLSKREASMLAKAMGAVYDRIKKDVEDGYIKIGETQ